MSFTECNGYHICLDSDLAQYVVCMMSTKTQSDISPGFYVKVALTFLIPFLHMRMYDNNITWITTIYRR